jgi:hypothetical protein
LLLLFKYRWKNELHNSLADQDKRVEKINGTVLHFHRYFHSDSAESLQIFCYIYAKWCSELSNKNEQFNMLFWLFSFIQVKLFYIIKLFSLWNDNNDKDIERTYISTIVTIDIYVDIDTWFRYSRIKNRDGWSSCSSNLFLFLLIY